MKGEAMKYFTLIAIILCVASVGAQMNTTAQSFLDKAKTFADTYLTHAEQLNAFKGAFSSKDQQGNTVAGTGFLGNIETTAKDVKKVEGGFDPAAYFNPTLYMNEVTQKVQTVLANSAMGDSKYADIRKAYLEQIADFCMKEYLQDMKQGITLVDTAAYLGDAQRVGDSKLNEINDRKNPPKSTSTVYDPKKILGYSIWWNWCSQK